MPERVPKATKQTGEYQGGKLWFERKGTLVTVGLTNVAVETLGSVEVIEFPNEGDDFNKGEVILAVEGSNGSIEVLAPATGMIHEINESLRDEPDRVSEDPFEEGWLVKIEIEDTSDLKEYSTTQPG